MPRGNQAHDSKPDRKRRTRRRALERIFRAAVEAVEPGRLVVRRLRDAPLSGSRIWIVAAGKAAPAMAKAAAREIGARLAGGIVVAPRTTRSLGSRFKSFVAGHPIPDRGSLAAGKAIWKLAGRLTADDLLLVLLSGGASSLVVLPAVGLSLADKAAVNRLLLRSRATIAEVNAVRKHLSRLKGGGLLRRAGRARVVSLLLSDVIGSSPAVIGSGPTATDSTTYADAWRVLERHGIETAVPASVRRHLTRGRRQRLPETLKPGERRVRNLVIGDNRLALAAAAAEARKLGFEPSIVTTSLRGETRRAARRFAATILERRRPRKKPACLLAGGETTVEVRGGGRGGRNQEFALELAGRLRDVPGVWCLSAGSDGRDGPTDAAGAFVDGATAARARELRLDPRAFLERNDSHRFFGRLGDLFRPGPTGTNVMDLKIVLLDRTTEGRGCG